MSVGHPSLLQPSLKHQPYLQKASVSWVPPENIAFFPPRWSTNSDGDTRGVLVLKDGKGLNACEAFRHKGAKASAQRQPCASYMHSRLTQREEAKRTACASPAAEAHTDANGIR